MIWHQIIIHMKNEQNWFVTYIQTVTDTATHLDITSQTKWFKYKPYKQLIYPLENQLNINNV